MTLAVDGDSSHPWKPLVITLAVLLTSAAEDRQEQEEHVEDIEEDRRGEKRRRADVLGVAQPLEIEQRQPGEDHETGDRVDQRAARDLNEHEHDPEEDQPDQRPEERTRERREVAPPRVAGG